MIVYERILNASEVARGTDFNEEKRVLARKFFGNIFKPVFCLFSDFLRTSSAEAIEIAQSKTQTRSSSVKKKARVSKPTQEHGCDTVSVSEIAPIWNGLSGTNSR
jgi:hypothetical protein